MKDLYSEYGFTCFCGGFGSGKTLSMVKYMAEKKEKGYFIISNFTTTISDMVITDFDEFVETLALIMKKTTDGKTGLEHDGIMPFGKKIVIAIDEAGIWFNNRNFSAFPKFLTSFMFLIRKFDVVPIYAVQEPDTVDVNFMRMTGQYRYHFKRFFNLICSQKIFRYPLANMFWDNKFRQKSLGSSFFIFPLQKKIFGLYNSREITIPRNGIPEISQELTLKFETAMTKWKNPIVSEKIAKRKKKNLFSEAEKRIQEKVISPLKKWIKKKKKQ